MIIVFLHVTPYVKLNIYENINNWIIYTKRIPTKGRSNEINWIFQLNLSIKKKMFHLFCLWWRNQLTWHKWIILKGRITWKKMRHVQPWVKLKIIIFASENMYAISSETKYESISILHQTNNYCIPHQTYHLPSKEQSNRTSEIFHSQSPPFHLCKQHAGMDTWQGVFH